MYDTENPVPRNGDGRRRRPTAAFRNVSVGAGALSAGAGVGYAGYRVGRAAEDWRKSSPAFAGRAAKAKTLRAWTKLRTILKLKSELRLIQLAAGDYARKYLVGEPLLARKGEEGYDPNVEREVQAALYKRQRPMSEEAQRRAARELGKTAILKPGYAPHEVEGGKKRFMPLVKIVRPYREIRKKMSQQQRELTKFPKEPEPPPPEMLSKVRSKTPSRGGEYEGGAVPDLWSREEAGKPTNIKYMYPERKHPHERPPLSAEEVSIRGRAHRDPMASHYARVRAGLTPSMVVKREKAIGGLPSRYLPKPADIEERRQAQAIRDYLAGNVRTLRREVIQPLRARGRREAGMAPVKPFKKTTMAGIRSASEAMGDLPIAPGTPFRKPGIKPTARIGGKEVHPAVFHRAHQELRSRVAAVTSMHVGAAASIKQNVHDRLQEHFAKAQHGRLLRGTADRLTNETFSSNRTSMEDWEVKALAEHTGTKPEWIQKQHEAFVKHTHLGATQVGEDKIRRALTPKVFAGLPGGGPEGPARAAYPALKRLGRRGAIGAGIAGALGIGAYGIHKARQRRMKETRFAVPGAVRHLQGKLKGLRVGKRGKHELIIGGALAGGITAADALTSAVFPDPEKSRKESALAGAKRGAVYGTVLAGAEPLIRIPLSRRFIKPHLMSAIRKEIQFQQWADIPSPGRRNRKLSVAQDRYRKIIREHEIQRKEANLAKSAVAGAALAGVLHGKVPLKHALIGGAAAGLGTQAALIARGRRSQDPYGEGSIAAKRVERLPYQVGALATGAVFGHRLYKNKKLRFNSKGKLIRFQQFIPVDSDVTPWHVREASRWLKHPRSRVENAQKWVGRAERIRRDINLPSTGKGQIVDERGRVRQPEWKKDWFKRSVVGGAAVGTLLGAAVLRKRIKSSAVTAAGLMEKGLAPSQGERMALNISSGNVSRAIREKFRSKFPRFTMGTKKMGGLGAEFRQAKENILARANAAVEGQTGRITSASIKRKKGNIVGVDVENPAKARENLDKIQAEEDRIKRRAEQLRRQRERVKGTQGTRGAMEKIIKAPEEKFHSRVKPIHFQEVYVRPHTRSGRRQKYRTEKKDFREGLLIGGGVGLGGLGLGGGLAYKSRQDALRKKFTEEAEGKLAKRIAQELGRVRPLKSLSAKLDDIISLK